MSFSEIKQAVIINLKNIPGPTTKRKIVVIESDDYGGIRMPSIEALDILKKAGISNLGSRYNQLDTLEDKDDLDQLFETLRSVRDKNDQPAVVSPFVNVANPCFDKIKAAGFRQYFYEPFTSTLQRYGRSDQTMEVWRQGMSEGIFCPEFHGREHISVEPWLEQLQLGNHQIIAAFEQGFVGAGNIKGIPNYAKEFRPEFYFTRNDQKNFLHTSIIEGVELFKQLFGYKPHVFAPGNSVFHPDFDDTVYKAGVPFMCVAHKNPCPGPGGKLTYKSFSFKQKIKDDQLSFYIRNCAFEPSDKSYTGIGLTLKQIEAAFRWHKPAIISTHRVNFTGGLNIENRKKGLKELSHLLNAIVQKWPDAEFMSTGNMLQQMEN